MLVTRAEFDPRALAAQAIQLRQRGVEGVIAVDTLPPRDLALPFEMVELPNQARSESAAKRLRTELEDTGAASAWRLLRKVEQTVVLHRDRPIEKVNPLAPTVAEIAKIGDAATASPFQFAD